MVNKKSPSVQVRETLGRFQVLVRERGTTWAEIVAEVKERYMADAVVERIKYGV